MKTVVSVSQSMECITFFNIHLYLLFVFHIYSLPSLFFFFFGNFILFNIYFITILSVYIKVL